ncbi:MAG: peptide MFS transporter [Bacteroidaceae bacterium]|jgi:POT family proton-dependent oligopeptide transporter|nr:peptide MFS transporter [Bacteroidaceae bacterium]MBQ8709511.1 peptide MFS transporter [Bacteroidaceae bacterium]MDY6257024.1 peptide MFS transporter [Bacteroidaceae bacterium]
MAKEGHPKGLYLLFVTEMAERFSYYGMRAVFTLYMVAALFTMESASEIYGYYTGLVYLTPLLGGYIADRYWGNRRSIIVGGMLMAFGQFLMFLSASFVQPAIKEAEGMIDPTVNNQLAIICMMGGLFFLILGNGFFKPNISTMVGSLYRPDDQRKDSAFTIFYMGINVGATLGPLTCGIFEGDYLNPMRFKWAFLCACIAMLASTLIFYLLKNKYLMDYEGNAIGTKPKLQEKTERQQLTRKEKQHIVVIFIIAAFVIFFWAAYEQAGVSLTYFADQQTDRHIFGWEMPTSYFQSFPAIFVVLLAPFMNLVWEVLRRFGHEPSSVMKQAIGLAFLSIGYMLIAFGVKDLGPNVKVSMLWLTGLYFIHTLGELSLSPIGLSLVSKLSPKHLASLMMGIWFMSTAVSNMLAGQLATLYPDGSSKSLFGIIEIASLHDFFMMFVVLSGVAAIALACISPLLNRMMRE